jgi:hypothetical protein
MKKNIEFDDEEYKKFKARCAALGITMKARLNQLVREDNARE